jgi:hypothetical protein
MDVKVYNNTVTNHFAIGASDPRAVAKEVGDLFDRKFKQEMGIASQTLAGSVIR